MISAIPLTEDHRFRVERIPEIIFSNPLILQRRKLNLTEYDLPKITQEYETETDLNLGPLIPNAVFFSIVACYLFNINAMEPHPSPFLFLSDENICSDSVFQCGSRREGYLLWDRVMTN